MFLARIIAFFLSQNSREDSKPAMSYLTVFILEIVLGFFGMLIVTWFSRHREFRADSGSARIVGREKMIAALERLQRFSAHLGDEPASLATLQISGRSTGIMRMLATHPPIEERIANLKRFV